MYRPTNHVGCLARAARNRRWAVTLASNFLRAFVHIVKKDNDRRVVTLDEWEVWAGASVHSNRIGRSLYLQITASLLLTPRFQRGVLQTDRSKPFKRFVPSRYPSTPGLSPVLARRNANGTTKGKSQAPTPKSQTISKDQIFKSNTDSLPRLRPF